MAATPPMLPTESEVTVLSSLTPLPAELRKAAMEEGLTFNAGGECATGGIWPIGCNDAIDVDDDATWKQMMEWGEPTCFESFIVTELINCPEGYIKGDSEGRAAEYMRASFEVVKHIGLAKQLWGVNAVSSGNGCGDEGAAVTLTSAATENTDAAFDTAAPIGAAIGQLVQARKNIAPGRVLLHMSWRALLALAELQLVTFRNGRYEGVGFTAVVDEGYPSADDDDDQYIIASGPVEYAWGSIIDNPALGIDPPGGFSRYTVWDFRQNRALLRVEQQAFVRFDPCGVLRRNVLLPTLEVA